MKNRQDIVISLFLTLGVFFSGCSATGDYSANGTKTATDSSPFGITVEGEKVIVSQGDTELLAYQKEPLSNPAGGEKFKASDFIHPLKTPAGFTITDIQPADHLHHFGLWWPWKYLKIDDRQVLFWELQRGEGIIQAQGVSDLKAAADSAGFTATSRYLDRTAPDGPEVILHEKAAVKVSGITESPARGYLLDITLTHSCATDSPVEVVKYRYSGFAIRGTAAWNRDNCTMLSSHGKEWTGSNFTRADWVRVQGQADEEKQAGFVMMSSPANRDAPQLLRTWDKPTDNAIFINFNPVQEKSWHFEPGKKYTSRYRLYIYDGTVTPEQTRQLWQEYQTNPPK